MINEDALKSIEKLHEMKTAGILSDDEFEVAKKGLLEGKRHPATASRTASAPAELPALDNHLGWMTLPLRRYAQFEGRSGRREFWMFLLLTNVVAAVLAVIVTADTNFLGYTGTLGNFAFGLLALGALAVIVPLIAVEVRRLHDQSRSGWLALINLLPYVGPFIVLFLMLAPSTAGDNEYGPEPRV
jgi:uncharacterized membrane protein YhaH (DUF805 family)